MSEFSAGFVFCFILLAPFTGYVMRRWYGALQDRVKAEQLAKAGWQQAGELSDQLRVMAEQLNQSSFACRGLADALLICQEREQLRQNGIEPGKGRALH